MASAFTWWWSNTRVTAPTADDNKIRRAASDKKMNVPHPDPISSPSCFTLPGIIQDLEYSASPAAALTQLWISWRGCVDGQWCAFCLCFTKKEAFKRKISPQDLPTQTLHFMDTWRKIWLYLRLRSCRFSERVMSLETNQRLCEQCPVCVGTAEKLPLNVKYERFSCADMTDFIHSAWNKTSLCVEGVGVSAYPEISLVNIEGPAEKPAAGLWCRPCAKSLKSQGSSPTEVRGQSSVEF